MTDDPGGSVTLWLSDLKAGAKADDAVQALWERYFEQLVRLARARLHKAPRGPANEEDAALSAFDSFCRRATAGHFPRLDDRGDLWRLLVTITARKAADYRRSEASQRRGGGRVVGESALDAAHSRAGRGLDQVIGREPTPAFAAQVADEYHRLLDALGDEGLRTIALLRMEGLNNGQIAERLGCGLRTVERKLELIRKTWSREVTT